MIVILLRATKMKNGRTLHDFFFEHWELKRFAEHLPDIAVWFAAEKKDVAFTMDAIADFEGEVVSGKTITVPTILKKQHSEVLKKLEEALLNFQSFRYDDRKVKTTIPH